MKKVCALIGKYFGVIAVIFLIIGMTLPTSFSWVLGKVGGISVLSVLLGVIMFGMGMTMSVHDFALVLKRPKDVFFGACAQYFVMPFLAYVLSTIFQLDPALTVGVVLVGTCPGGTSSNVITFMSKGDVPLSVTMTSVSTLISPIMTPLLTYLIIGQRISFDPVGMFLSILQIVIVPLLWASSSRASCRSWLIRLRITCRPFRPWLFPSSSPASSEPAAMLSSTVRASSCWSSSCTTAWAMPWDSLSAISAA